MKLFNAFIFFMTTYSTLFSMVEIPKCEENDLSKEVSIIINSVAKKAEDEFGIELIGSGASMPNNVFKKYNLSFRVEKSLNKAETKMLLSSIAKYTIQLSERSLIMNKYLKNRPFAVQNVSINLFFYRSDGHVFTYPNYCCAGLSEGIYDFRTLQNEDDFQYKTTEKEPYK